MGRNKRDAVWEDHYSPFLNAGKKYNTAFHRKELHQRVHFRMLMELAMNRFSWHGLPDSVDERYLEMSLINNGSTLFHWMDHEDYGQRYLISNFTSGARPNHYNNPTEFRPVLPNGINLPMLNSKEAVPIWNNYMRMPDNDIIYLYATKLTEIDLTIEITSKNLRIPKVVKASEGQRLTYENIIDQMDNGIPVIFGTDQLNTDAIDTLDLTPHHEILPGLLATRTKMYGECMTALGVSTVNSDKKERMITGEVDASQDQAAVTRNIALKSRERACLEINRLFPDLDVSVSWAAESLEADTRSGQQGMLEGEESMGGDGGGNIHHDASGIDE